MDTDQHPLWITLELDPGAADFFGLPVRLAVPDDPATPVLSGFESHTAFPVLARALERALELDPEFPGRGEAQRFVRRWPRYADLDRYLRMGNPTFAETVARSLLRDDPQDPPPLAALAFLAATTGDWHRALDLWRQVQDRAPTYAPARLHYALALAAVARRDEALEHLEFLAHRSRVQPLARLWHHELRHYNASTFTGRLRAALQPGLGVGDDTDTGWSAIEAAFPGNPEVLYAKTVRPGGVADEAEREALLRRAVDADPSHVPAVVALAALLRREGRAEEALAVLDRADGNPPRGAVIAARGQTFEQLGRAPEALAAYRSIFAGEGAEPLAHLPGSALLIAGQGLVRLGELDTARSFLEDALEARPGDPLPHQLLARLDESTAGGAEAAEHRLREAVRICGPLPMVQYALGDLLRRNGRRVEAEGLFKVLARRHAGSPWGHRGLGDLQVETQPVKAVEHYAEAVRLDPATPIPGYDYLLGVAALRAGDLETARMRLQRAVAAEPDNARYWCDLGAVAFYEGQPAAAIRFTRRALEREPGHPGFLHNLAAYERAGFRKHPWNLGALWRSWRFARQARRGAESGWRKDLWKPEAEPATAGPPPAAPERSDPPPPGPSENS